MSRLLVSVIVLTWKLSDACRATRDVSRDYHAPTTREDLARGVRCVTGDKALHPNYYNPHFPNDIPSFNCTPLSLEQCKYTWQNSNNRQRCHFFSERLDCKGQTTISVTCRSEASKSDLADFAIKTANFSRLQPVSIVLHYAPSDLLQPQVLAPIRQQVVELTVWENCYSPTSKLPALNLENLLRLKLQMCQNLIIRKDDFSKSKRLRMIQIELSTIQSIEPGTFTDLPDLQYLGLEEWWELQRTYSSVEANHLRRFHCGCDYQWLRNWLNQRQKIMAEKADGDIYAFGTHKSPATVEKPFVPVDCSVEIPLPHLINWRQKQFAINVSC